MLISSENFRDASIARDCFLGLIYRLLKEGQIIHCQFYFYPKSFDWLEYLESSIDPQLDLEMDVELLQMGAALTAVNWIENSYSQESFSEKYVEIVSSLRRSKWGERREFQRFLDEISYLENLEKVEASLHEIFNMHVRQWWLSQVGRDAD
jgi:hypothetical protein